jgi:hypothetical protein
VLSYTGGEALARLRSELGRGASRRSTAAWTGRRTIPVPPVAAYRADLSYLGTYAGRPAGGAGAAVHRAGAAAPGAALRHRGAQYPHDFPWTENIHFVRHMPPPEHPAFFSSSRLTLNVTRRAWRRWAGVPRAGCSRRRAAARRC